MIAQSDLSDRTNKVLQKLKDCTLCPRRCAVDRLEGEKGVCSTGRRARVAGVDAHFGEERPLVGKYGSGTIFFGNCNLLCNFCQNYDISHGGAGRPVSDEDLAQMMLSLQHQGCHNINLVTPSHVVPQIIAALEIAKRKELNLPIVYNSSGYDRVSILKLLDGLVDIYMPDFKFWDESVAEKTCGAPDYPEAARRAINEMHRQVGDLTLDANGIAIKGLLLRHLVLPDGLAGTRDIIAFVVREISSETYVNIMPQYRPCGRAAEIKALARPITSEEFEIALQDAKEMGIHRLDQQPRIFIGF